MGNWRPLDLRKYVGGVRVCFDPLKMSHSYIQNCCWITLQVLHHQGWKTWQKWKVKLIFWGAWNSLMAFPDWPWPPYFSADLRHWVKEKRSSAIASPILTISGSTAATRLRMNEQASHQNRRFESALQWLSGSLPTPLQPVPVSLF